MPLSLQRVTGPLQEPVNLALAKQQINRGDYTGDDNLIQAYIVAARVYAESYTHRAVFPQTWVRTLDHFPLWWAADGTVNPSYKDNWPYYSDFWNRITIDLPMPRLLSVQSITYVDTSGVTQTLDPSQYVVDTTSEPARIVPAEGTYWPSQMTYIPGSVRITFMAGTYVQVQTDVVTVPSAAPFHLSLTNADGFLGMLSLTAPGGAAVPYSVAAGVVTVDSSFAGQSLTAQYYVPESPMGGLSNIVTAMLFIIGHLYEHREAVSDSPLKAIPFAAEAFLDFETCHAMEYRP
jgi:hypothetical protein